MCITTSLRLTKRGRSQGRVTASTTSSASKRSRTNRSQRKKTTAISSSPSPSRSLDHLLREKDPEYEPAIATAIADRLIISATGSAISDNVSTNTRITRSSREARSKQLLDLSTVISSHPSLSAPFALPSLTSGTSTSTTKHSQASISDLPNSVHDAAELASRKEKEEDKQVNERLAEKNRQLEAAEEARRAMERKMQEMERKMQEMEQKMQEMERERQEKEFLKARIAELECGSSSSPLLHAPVSPPTSSLTTLEQLVDTSIVQGPSRFQHIGLKQAEKSRIHELEELLAASQEATHAATCARLVERDERLFAEANERSAASHVTIQMMVNAQL